MKNATAFRTIEIVLLWAFIATGIFCAWGSLHFWPQMWDETTTGPNEKAKDVVALFMIGFVVCWGAAMVLIDVIRRGERG